MGLKMHIYILVLTARLNILRPPYTTTCYAFGHIPIHTCLMSHMLQEVYKDQGYLNLI